MVPCAPPTPTISESLSILLSASIGLTFGTFFEVLRQVSAPQVEVTYLPYALYTHIQDYHLDKRRSVFMRFE